MFADYLKKFVLAVLAVFLSLPTGNQTAEAEDIILLDLSAVDPSVQGLFTSAEQFWEDRIRGYSFELPTSVRNQLTQLVISATVTPIDGVGGTLGAAGPDGTVGIRFTDRKPYVIPVTASMFFDIDDFPQLEADGILEQVIIHEMGHALGFGSLWEDNRVTEELQGLGETQYVGRYGLQGYGQDIGNPTVLFVPLEQDGGDGTALAHWDDAPPFFNQVFTDDPKKEIMAGFLCDVDAAGNTICAPKFLSRASLGSLADLGYAINGFNEQFVAPRNFNAVPDWPKVVSAGTQNQLFTAGDRATGLRYDLSRSYVTLKASKNSIGSKAGNQPGGNDRNGPDPYGLRNHSWAK